MSIEMIQDRGRGPEIVGTRVTVYNLLPHFSDPTATEGYICTLYGLSPEQVAAARAYIFQNPDSVLAEHLKIEARIAAGNPPEIVERAKKTHDAFVNYKAWLAERRATEDHDRKTERNGFPTFREWMADRESRSAKGS